LMAALRRTPAQARAEAMAAASGQGPPPEKSSIDGADGDGAQRAPVPGAEPRPA
jgi:hypothetical protein